MSFGIAKHMSVCGTQVKVQLTPRTEDAAVTMAIEEECLTCAMICRIVH